MQIETFIHPTAIIHPGAELDVGVFVGPYCIVGEHLKIGKNTKLNSHVVLAGNTQIGSDNEIFPFASIGHAPQDLKYKGEPTLLVIGNDNRIREGVTLQPGTVQGGGKTIIGNNNLFMANSHVAHDCIVGDSNVFANSSALAGHTTICNQAVLGGMAGIHQFCTVGDMAMIGFLGAAVQDIPHYCIVEGNRAVLRGLNVVAMRRRGLTTESINAVKRAYRIMFHQGHPTVSDAALNCEAEGLLNDFHAQRFVEFIKNSKRGVVRPATDGHAEGDTPL